MAGRSEFPVETNKKCAAISSHAELNVSALPMNLKRFKSYNGTTMHFPSVTAAHLFLSVLMFQLLVFDVSLQLDFVIILSTSVIIRLQSFFMNGTSLIHLKA